MLILVIIIIIMTTTVVIVVDSSIIIIIILFLHIGIVITITPVHSLFIIFLFGGGWGKTAILKSLFPLHTTRICTWNYPWPDKVRLEGRTQTKIFSTGREDASPSRHTYGPYLNQPTVHNLLLFSAYGLLTAKSYY
jgi:hypothetical protein